MKKGMGAKKHLAALLAVMMVFSCCPVSVLAEETAKTATQTEVTEILETVAESGQEEETALSVDKEDDVQIVTIEEIMPLLGNGSGVVDSGSCGTNVTYTLYSDGELVISGTEAMTNYNYTDAPWYSNHDSIKTVAIESGVTSIGDRAFENCWRLTSITIPDSVTSIGYEAFCGCSSLTSITIGDGVTSIDSKAFSGTAYYNNGNNWVDGVLYIGNHLIKARGSVSGSYSIRAGTLCIGDSAFSGCSSLTSITIPDGVTSIGSSAFYNCSSLESVTIPDGVTSIGYSAFYNCSSLESVTIPDGVTSIGSDAFENCNSLTSVAIGDGVTSIGKEAFYGCSSLTSVAIPDSVTNIDNDAFSGTAYYNDSDNWVDGVLYIGNHLIKAQNSVSGNYSIREGTLCIGDSAFGGCSSLTSITIPDSVTSIGYFAFGGCSSLTSITIPDSVTSIGEWAFFYCSSLTSITIPDSVTSIGRYSFYNCSSLTSIMVDEGNTVYHSAGNCLIETASKSLICGCNTSVIPTDGSVTSIGEYAFENCSSLTSITIPDSVTTIAEGTFNGCGSLNNITADEGNPVYHSAGNCLIQTESKVLVVGCNTSVIPDDGSVTSIGYAAFLGRSSLKSITIPDSVTSIGDSAFENCSSLTSIAIPNSVTTIAEESFSGCGSLNNITADEGNPVYHSAGNCLIQTESKVLVVGCNTSVIPDDGSVTSIGCDAFSGRSSLTSITIPDSITTIDFSAFYGCSSLTSITIPDSVTSIASNVFSDCSSLTSITIPNSLNRISFGMFCGCSSLTSITIPDSVTRIDYCAFQGCSSLTSITIPDSITTINYEAFYECSSLTSITIPDSVTCIAVSAFHGCSSLTDVYYLGSLSQWAAISVGEDNEKLKSAVMHMRDIDGDNVVTVLDMQALYEHLCGATPLTDDYALTVADVNGDGDVNILDYQALYEKIR